jgi:hypothetical protein
MSIALVSADSFRFPIPLLCAGAVLAVTYHEHATSFDRLRRYSTTAERTFFRATLGIGYDSQSRPPRRN